MERHHLRVTRKALRENRLVIFGLCLIGLRRHGPFISCHIFLPLCFALSGTYLGSSFFVEKIYHELIFVQYILIYLSSRLDEHGEKKANISNSSIKFSGFRGQVF